MFLCLRQSSLAGDVLFYIGSFLSKRVNVLFHEWMNLAVPNVTTHPSTASSGQIVKSEQGERFPLPSVCLPFFPYPFSSLSPFPFLSSLPLEVAPLESS